MSGANKDILASFDLPPEKMIEYLEGKGHKITFNYDEMKHYAHMQSFTVAKVMRNDLLYDLHESIVKSMQEGTGFDEWKREIKPTLKSYGWLGEVDITDPRTGEVKTINVNSRRLETIYQTNMRTSQAKARYDEMMSLSDAVYWRYMCRNPETSRHKKWNGQVRHRDDPWWKTHYPPNDWGCLCYITAHTLKEVKSNGWTILSPVSDSGETDDISPDWAYNVGDTSNIAKVENIQITNEFIKELPYLKPDTKYADLNGSELKKVFFNDLGIKEGDTFIDKIGDPIIIDNKIFSNAIGTSKIKKGDRHLFIAEFANVLKSPDEITLEWETLNYPVDGYIKDDQRLVKKFIKHYVNAKGKHRIIIAVADYKKDKTQGITVHVSDKVKKRSGKVIFSKD